MDVEWPTIGQCRLARSFCQSGSPLWRQSADSAGKLVTSLPSIHVIGQAPCASLASRRFAPNLLSCGCGRGTRGSAAREALCAQVGIDRHWLAPLLDTYNEIEIEIQMIVTHTTGDSNGVEKDVKLT